MSILLIVAAFIAIILILLLIHLRKKSAHYQLAAILKPYIQEEIKGVIIPDGIGGLLEIEHLILTQHGLLLLEAYPMSGNMFGAEAIDMWTQLINGKSYKFANPLRRIRISRQALMILVPNIPIFCRVIFNADSNFPKGKPEEVSVLSSLSDDLVIMHSSIVNTNQILPAWQRLLRIARKDGQAIQRDGEV